MTREVAVARLQANFVAGVSHEFRTPLTSLCQMSELLARGRVTGDANRETYYRLLNAESQRLRRLVENLLTFGRIDSGQLAFKSEPNRTRALRRWGCVRVFRRAPGVGRPSLCRTGAAGSGHHRRWIGASVPCCGT